ncbi:hypothetical protein BGZ98_008595 [Dissophora globulifera]|nr:hypothetical protein BGZ98_008595 [Dissophora globulifera]
MTIEQQDRGSWGQQQQQQQQHHRRQQSPHITTEMPKLPRILPPPGSQPDTGSGSGFVSGIEAAAASALTLANNIAFRPMTTQPAKCSKLKIRIFFDSTIFQAGGNLFGRMEVTATSSRSLKLGEIAVELAAYEEITSKEFTATQSFLSSRLSFQGPNIPPSNAVHGPPCDENGFWMAKKGKTTFPFAFQLPLDCPSSLVFGQTASLRYVVTGLVQVFYHGKDEMILKSKEAFVVEAWDGYNPDYRIPVGAANSTKLFWGGSGSLVLEAMLSERLHSAGGNLTVEVKVKNNTSRKVQGIRLGVHRRLEMVSNKDKAQQNPGLRIDTVSVSEVVGTQEFKSSSYLFDTGEERTMTVNMIVPGNARTIRGTALFEVTCFVVVSMLLGTFSGELSVEIPVKICHPASLTPAPKPKLDENHLPHHYNLVDEDLDLSYDRPTRSNRRVGSNDSLAAPITSGHDPSNQAERGRELPWSGDGSGEDDKSSAVGRQGEWSQDAQELSPANSITSIRSILASPKQKLSRLADKIQRSTSPSSSHHLQHDHRQGGSKHLDDQGRRHMIAKSPPLGPAQPIAYVPAVERVRYTPFQPPPTTKAKEFLKAAAQYQQEMSFGGALSGLGSENTEFNLDDKAMASAIHQWISKKESESMYHSTAQHSPPIQIPANNRRRPAVNRINTQVGSFTSQYSPTSPQSHDSPASLRSNDFPPSPGLNNQTMSRFLHHPHRQPAAPQTAAYGSAPEDCLTDPPLFAKPLPLPSPPRTGSPHRAMAMNPSRARSLSPVPIQTPENLALAREAFERVRRMASPVRGPMADEAASSGNRESHSGFVDPPRHPPHEVNPNIMVPVPTSAAAAVTSTNFVSNPAGLSRLLGNSNGTDEGIIEPPRLCSSPELRHVPLNRPLPVPGPKPSHLNKSGSPGATGASPSQGSGFIQRSQPVTRQPESGALPATSSGYLRNPTPVSGSGSAILSTSPPANRNGVATRSAHLSRREHNQGDLDNGSGSTIQRNAYVPKPTPMPTARPPAPIERSVGHPPKPARAPTTTRNLGLQQDGNLRQAGISAAGAAKANVANSGGSNAAGGFVYPKTARKPVSGTKPAVAAKPRGLVTSSPSSRSGVDAAKTPARTSAATSPDATVMNQQTHAEFDQRLRRQAPALVPSVSKRAPQVVTEPQMSPPTQVVIGFKAPPKGITTVVEEEEIDSITGEGLDSKTRNAPQDSRHQEHQSRYHQHHHHHHHHKEDDRSALKPSVVVDHSFDEQGQAHETASEIRAQAIAAAHSFRATGANSGGYVVNTGILRQVIKDSNGPSGGGSSGQLMQAFADGAKNAASAAVSGFGWRQQPLCSEESAEPKLNVSSKAAPKPHSAAQNQLLSISASSPASSPPSRSQVQQPDNVAPLPRSRPRPVDQVHDLTMKDIHFQTLSPSDHQSSAPLQVISPSTIAETPATTTNTTTTTTTKTTTTKTREYEKSKSHHIIRSDNARVRASTEQQSQSQPGSRVLDGTHRNEQPLPAKATSAVVHAVPDPSSTAAAFTESTLEAASAPPNLDKTLPKIQEQTPRSRVFERPEKKAETTAAAITDANTNLDLRPNMAMSPGKVGVGVKPHARSRYGVQASEAAAAGGGSAGVSAAGPKVINPKVQAYIQRYNLAARS